MEIKIKINQDKIEKAVTEVIANKMWEKDRGRMRFGRSDVEKAIYDKALLSIQLDKKFDEEIKREIKKKLNNKTFIGGIAKEIIKEKMETNDY